MHIKATPLRLHSTIYFLMTGLLVLGLALALMTTRASAATHTVNAGQSIQAAINAAGSGDTVVVNAGTYTEYLNITKPLTLVGNGTVIVQTKSSTNTATGHPTATGNKGVDIQNTQNVTIENITFDGESSTAQSQTGIDINSVAHVALTNVTVKNYDKNGISVVTQQDAGFQAGGDVSFTNVSVHNVGWAGIALYTQSTLGYEAPLTDVAFNGTTTIEDTQYGIQFGVSGAANEITGINGAPVNLGTVAFVNNTANIRNDTQNVSISISSDSTVNGQPLTSADLPAGLAVTIVTVPGVPNTGRL